MRVQFDSDDKFGIIRKEILIKTNDSEKPELMLVLEADITENPHAVMSEMSSNKASIFEGSCRSCHVDRGVGKFAKELYAVSCQMCHGEAGKQDGKVHPGTNFSKQWLTGISTETLRERIAKGTPDERKKGMMPGFQDKYGGPLTENQVESLVSYLKSISNN